MKSAFPAAALVLLVGITIPATAREGRGPGGPPQAARPAQQQARPVPQQRQDRLAAREPAQASSELVRNAKLVVYPARRTV